MGLQAVQVLLLSPDEAQSGAVAYFVTSQADRGENCIPQVILSHMINPLHMCRAAVAL